MTATKTRPAAETANQPVAEPETVALQSAPIADVVKKLGGGLIAFQQQKVEGVAEKMALRQRIRQHLAEVADMAKEVGDASSEVTTKSASVGFELFEARKAGDLSPVEVSDILGDIFGVKGTGKFLGSVMRPGEKGAGKTPAGVGEDIRKRVTRAHSAWDYTQNGLSPSTKYFDGLEVEEVGAVLDQLEAEGEHNIYWLYRELTEMKRDASDPIPFHLNAERIAAFATKLGENIKATAASINKDGELKASYAGLLQTLLVANELIDA